MLWKQSFRHGNLYAVSQKDMVYLGQDDGGIRFQLIAGLIRVERDPAAVLHHDVHTAFGILVACVAVVAFIFNEGIVVAFLEIFIG